MTLHEIALLRLVAQRIAGPGLPNATDAVRWLTATQAQDHAGAVTSVALRTAAGTRAGVEAGCSAGEIVKSWPMRGTLHLVVAEDLPWMLRLLAPRVVAAALARHAAGGLDAPMIERARLLTLEALTGGHQMRREDLFTVWAGGGLVTAEQRGYRTLWHLAQAGVVCFGPIRDGEPLLVLVDEWIVEPHRTRHPSREEALLELALRYFRSHGPATGPDFARWAKLVVADGRTGLALARPLLATMAVDGVEYFLDPQTPDLLAGNRQLARGVFLLPGFDEFILGYADRRAVLAPEFADRIVPGGNGVFRPTVVSDGRVVGTWKHVTRGAERSVAAAPFGSFSDEVAAAIPQVYATLWS